MPIIDWTSPDPEPEFKKREEGVYKGRISNCEFKTSSKGNPMFQLTVEVMDKDNPMTTFNVRDWIMLDGKAFYLGRKKLKELGLGGKETVEPSDLMGIYVEVFLRYGAPNDKGRTYLEITRDDPAGFPVGIRAERNDPLPNSAVAEGDEAPW